MGSINLLRQASLGIEALSIVVIRAIVGSVFILAGAYVGYYALHPINNLALGIAAGLFLTGGLTIDLDDVGKALVKLGETKLTIPK